MSLDDLRRAKVNRAFVFYAKLCSEMLFHCTDNGNKIHMSERKQQEMQVFWDRYDEIRAGVDDNLALRGMKTLAGDITRFCMKSYPLRRSKSDTKEDNLFLQLKNWRWQHLCERAQKWQEIAKNHDWSHDLHMHPQFPSEEDWWAPPHMMSTQCVRMNQYLVT